MTFSQGTDLRNPLSRLVGLYQEVHAPRCCRLADDGMDDETHDRTDGQRENDDDDEGTRQDGRGGYPIFGKKYIDGLPLEIDTHRHFQTSQMISEPVRMFVER